MNCATNTFPLRASLSFLIYKMRAEDSINNFRKFRFQGPEIWMIIWVADF